MNNAPRVPIRDEEQAAKAEALAREILKLCLSTLLVDLRFLAPALSRLTPLDDGTTVTLATDGDTLRFNPVYVLKRWQSDQAVMIRSYLHMALHCVYHHPFMDAEAMLPACWDLACDIAAEVSIDALELSTACVERSEEAETTLHTLRKALGGNLTAERIYRYYADQALTETALEELRAPFFRDEHKMWYARREETSEKEKSEQDEENAGKDGSAQGRQREGDSPEERSGQGEQADGSRQQPERAPQPDAMQLKAQWDKIAARVQTDLETHSRLWADRAAGLLINLKEGTRSRLSYRDFLRRFTVLTEVPEADPDSFDPILYAYGTQLYGNMPILEPQETSERQRIRDLVIVIDTSASVQGERVQAFVQRTCEILLEQNTFDSRFCLHLLECDAAVQRDTVITSAQELAAFAPHGTLQGRGGTDFRPAFRYIDELLERGELPCLRGILYLTDGCGTYPEHPPRCETAMVFVNREDADNRVPPWALRVIMDDSTLDQPQILYFA